MVSLVSNGRLCVGTYSNPTAFTHKKPVTTKLLAQRIRDVLNADDVETTEWAFKELCSISRELESLGDNDE